MHTKTALITGASRGIGKALAEAFAAAGYDLYLTCIHSKELLHSLCRRLSEQYQIRCIPFVGDMGDYETVKQLFSGISYLDVVNMGLGVMDATAATMCKDNHIPIIVFDLTKEGNILRAVMGENIGTIIGGE